MSATHLQARQHLRAWVLFTSGLDCQLTVRVLQSQGIEVVGVHGRTHIECGGREAQVEAAAQRLGIPLRFVKAQDDYIELLRCPRKAGRVSKGSVPPSPCLDCRIHLFRQVRSALDGLSVPERPAFLASGEVVGQRPGQNRRDLGIAAHAAGLDDQLLRPLSARLLPPTQAERAGWVDRQQLFDFSGRGRKRQLELARQLGIDEPPAPLNCPLDQPDYAAKVQELLHAQAAPRPWDFELLHVGRHIPIDGATKAVLGRRSEENKQLTALASRADASHTLLLQPDNFIGPTALVIGTRRAAMLESASESIPAGNADIKSIPAGNADTKSNPAGNADTKSNPTLALVVDAMLRHSRQVNDEPRVIATPREGQSFVVSGVRTGT